MHGYMNGFFQGPKPQNIIIKRRAGRFNLFLRYGGHVITRDFRNPLWPKVLRKDEIFTFVITSGFEDVSYHSAYDRRTIMIGEFDSLEMSTASHCVPKAEQREKENYRAKAT